MTFALFKIHKRKDDAHAPLNAEPDELPGHAHAHEHEESGHHSEHSHAEHNRGPLPFIASPVDPEALKWLAKRKRASGVGKGTSIAAFEADGTESAQAKRIFRKQHEASSLELFFDLFFVGNLAVYTTISAHVDEQSLINYIGFFAILWTTWFHVSMYDVRFYTDSIFTRVIKFGHMGVMVSLVGLTSMYQAVLKGVDGQSRAFHGVAILMFISRILHLVQYAVVLFFVRVFDKTLVPMLLTMFVYVAAGFAFLSTYLMDNGQLSLSGPEGQAHVRIWYVIMSVEAVLVITIASIWRILSFKHTHLVERVGLLSLIIMGEGIIGLVKSTAYAVQGASQPLVEEAAITGVAVLIIYLIYILYFDNIDHHRFGTIKQQIWTLLHFPVHVSILLTVEGSTALLIWNSCRNAIKDIQGWVPTPYNPKGEYTDLTSWTYGLSEGWNYTVIKYHYKDLSNYYNQTAYAADVAKMTKSKAAFGSAQWNSDVGPVLKKMQGYLQYFVYQNFGAEGPDYKIKKTPDYNAKVALYEEGFKFVTIYYYISAGALLLMLALLYTFGRKRATGIEWGSFGVRVLGGVCLPLATISPFMEKAGEQKSLRFQYPALIIPIVAMGYFLVIVVDNIVKAIGARHFTMVEKRHASMDYGKKAARVTEEERELTDEESSYEMHRQQRPHGTPQMVQQGVSDHDALMQNVQGPPTAQYVPQGPHPPNPYQPYSPQPQPAPYRDEEAAYQQPRY